MISEIEDEECTFSILFCLNDPNMWGRVGAYSDRKERKGVVPGAKYNLVEQRLVAVQSVTIATVVACI